MTTTRLPSNSMTVLAEDASGAWADYKVITHPDDALSVAVFIRRNDVWEIVQAVASFPSVRSLKKYATLKSAMEAAARDIDWLFLVDRQSEPVPNAE